MTVFDPHALVRDTELAGLDEARAVVVGRALGTLARRRDQGALEVVVGREPDPACAAVRDGVVRGLLLSGQSVVDVGEADALRHEAAMRALATPAGVRVGRADDEVALEIFLGGPLNRPHLEELATIAAEGPLASGSGALRAVALDDLALDEDRSHLHERTMVD